MAMFSLPFPSSMVNGLTILEIPDATLDGEQYESLVVAIENVFPDLSQADVDEAISSMLKQSTARFISNHLTVYRPKRRTQEKVNLDDITNRYNNSQFDTDNDDSEGFDSDSDG